jgi:hypothetical protein
MEILKEVLEPYESLFPEMSLKDKVPIINIIISPFFPGKVSFALIAKARVIIF